MSDAPIRLNIGCGGRPLPEYINVDMDDLESLRKRYPNQVFADSLRLENYDIFNLPFPAGGVDEVRADGLLEHLSFLEEKAFLYEVRRVLRAGGRFAFSVPDFEQVCRDWLAAKDDWQEFYRSDDEAIAKQHWFGTYSYGKENRWGYMVATIYGSQHGAGQFHKNCYSEGKVRAMCKYLGLNVETLTRDLWKGDRDPMLNVIAIKT